MIQDIFIWFWQSRGQLEIVNCRAYLLTAVKFKTANYIRDNKIGKGFFAELSTVEVADNNEEAAMEVRELSALLRD